MSFHSIIDLAGAISDDTFAFSFPYLSEDHIHVYLDGEETEDFSFASAFVVELDTPLAADATVRVQRLTPIDEPAVDFVNGAVLGESDLDSAGLQLLYAMQETADDQLNNLRLAQNQLDQFDALDNRIINVGTPTADTDAATKEYVDDMEASALSAVLAQQVLSIAAVVAQEVASSAAVNLLVDDAETAEAAAASSETAAALSETAAAASEAAAALSASGAASSKTAADADAVAAAASAAAAAVSQSAAAASAAAAVISASGAATSKTGADSAAAAALVSQTAAASSKTAADADAAAAASSASGASTSAGTATSQASAASSAAAALVAAHAGKVLLIYTGSWAAYDSTGATISIGSSTTNGLQEAITNAYTNHKPLWVTGGGTLTCTTAIAVPAGFNESIYIETGITIAFGTLAAADLFVFNSQENCHIVCKAIITQTAGNTGAVMAIKPSSAAPTTGNTVVAASVFEIGDLVPASTGYGMKLDMASGGIIGNKIFIADVNGGTDAIRVTNPGTNLLSFEENHIEWGYIHGQSAYGLRVLTSTTNQTTVRRNLYTCGRLSPSGASSIAISTYESNSVFLHVSASNEEGLLNKGLVFQSGANNNNVLGMTITGYTTSSIENNGAGNIVIASGLSVPVGGSTSTMPVRGALATELSATATIGNTNETDLQTYTFPANAFNTNKQAVHIKAWGTFAANGNNKTVRIYFGSVAFVNSTAIAANGTKWVIEGTVYRTGSSTQKSVGHIAHGTTEVGHQQNTLTETDTAAITIKVTGQNGTSSANDIVCQGMTVEFQA